MWRVQECPNQITTLLNYISDDTLLPKLHLYICFEPEPENETLGWSCVCIYLNENWKLKWAHLIIFDTLYGEMIAVVPESTPELADAISLQLLEHLRNMNPPLVSSATLISETWFFSIGWLCHPNVLGMADMSISMKKICYCMDVGLMFHFWTM